jgi:hypothetical protein
MISKSFWREVRRDLGRWFAAGRHLYRSLKDFALRLAPFSKSDAEILSSLKAYAVLKKTPASIELLNDALLRLSDLAIELNGRIQALDINPIALGAADLGAVVLDAKVHI